MYKRQGRDCALAMEVPRYFAPALGTTETPLLNSATDEIAAARLRATLRFKTKFDPDLGELDINFLTSAGERSTTSPQNSGLTSNCTDVSD